LIGVLGRLIQIRGNLVVMHVLMCGRSRGRVMFVLLRNNIMTAAIGLHNDGNSQRVTAE